ncbi:3-oxoacyl-[acyl-carrier-protein] reductase, partial [Trachymyrmex zeteki]
CIYSIFNVNVRSVFQLTALAVPHLIKTKGNIVNVSSVTGLRPMKNNLPYCMSKLDLASRQVRVNSVNPGTVQTDILRDTGMSQEQIKIYYEQCKGTHALGRNGDSLEIAKTITFLASDDASFITGVTLLVDGGENFCLPSHNVESITLEFIKHIEDNLTRLKINSNGFRNSFFPYVRSIKNITENKSDIDVHRCGALLDASSLKNVIYFVRVNSVNPGAVITNIFRNCGMSQEQLKTFFEQFKGIHALGRNGDASEIAKVIIFLASDDASFMTGVTLPVDGGGHAMPPNNPFMSSD